MMSSGHEVDVGRAVPDYKYVPQSEFLTSQVEYSQSCVNVWGLA